MKNIRYTLPGILLLILLAGCEKDDKDTAFGEAVLYMPQATIAGLRYAVPSGLDSATRNYVIDASGKVNVILGVSRSGLQSYAPCTVTVQTDADTVQQMISDNILDAANHLLMPADVYTLPSSLDIPATGNAATFYLALDPVKLQSYTGKILVLAVKIGNPSAYTVNPAIGKVIILVDVDKLPL